MKILHISSLWPPAVLGGAELYAARLAAEEAACGHELGAVTLGVHGERVLATVPAWPYRLDRLATQPAWRKALFHARDLYDPVAAWAVRRAIDEFRPDVVHTHAVAGMSASVLTAAGARGLPSVHTLHDHWLLCDRTTLVRANDERCTRRCSRCRAFSASRAVLLRRRFADVVIAPSESVARTHVDAWPWLEPRIVKLHHPGDQATSERPRSPGRLGKSVTFGYLGNLIAAKGIRTLLGAFALLPAGRARLVVAGAGALADEVDRAGSSGDVRFLGWVAGEEREAFFDAVDCLVVPSQVPEAAGLAVAEARQRGLPVIAADIGALPEYVDPASRPLLFSPGDAEALRRSLAAVVGAHEAYLPTGPPPPTWPEHVAEILALYERLRAARSSGV